ncbi:hypothetical protein ACWD2L_00375 [Streptomyces sp. NPDC002754]
MDDNSPKNLDSSNAYYRGTVAGLLQLVVDRVAELRKHNTEGTIVTDEAQAAIRDLTLNASLVDTAVTELRLRAETAALIEDD